MYYHLIAQIKAVYRVALFYLGSPEFSPYSDAARETSGYEGSYAVRGRCVAFRRNDGTRQFVW